MIRFFESIPEVLADHCEAIDLPRFVSRQLLDWVYGRQVVDPDRMTNISAAGRARIRETIAFDQSHVVRHQVATDDTQKLLLGWIDPEHAGEVLPVLNDSSKQTETVMIPTPSRKTACVSSQVGCPVGCTFCASGVGGLDGNLRPSQIIEQIHRLGRLPGVGRVSNVVFMGMGEPLANFKAVTDAIRIMNADWGLGIGARRITVSTVGLPAAIRKLVNFEIPVTLALSLHAPNDDLRRKIIPWAEYAPIEELLDSCDEYFQKTGREITLEYILLRRFNDRLEHAQELAQVATRLRANINLIRYNEVKGLPFDRPTTNDVRAFQGALRKAGVNVHIRASRGRDIAAACGQLRYEHTKAAS